MKREETLEMARLYADGQSLSQIATTYGLTRQTIWSRLTRAGVAMRPQQRTGADNHFYRGGGRKFTHRGYVKVYVSGKWLFEHRVVMEEQLGRSLKPSEHVHHLNGIKSDNSPGNLALMASAGHMSHHKKGRVVPREAIEKQRSKLLGKWIHRPDITVEAVTDLKRQGLSINQIALHLGCSWDAVSRRLRGADDEHPSPKPLSRDRAPR